MATRKTRKVKRYLLQSYWSDAPLSLLEKTCLSSWVAYGARVDLFTHDSIKSLETQLEYLPAHIRNHIRILDADMILSREKKFKYEGGPKSKRSDAFSALPFSDLFRYEMLRQRGGIWIDMDIILIRPIPASILRQPYFFTSERTMQAGAYKSAVPFKPVNSCIGVREPYSEWATKLVEASKNTKMDSAWTYMKVFQKSLTGLEKYIQPPTFMMPVNWWDVDGIFKPIDCLQSKYGVPSTCASFMENPETVGVHLFRGILRKRDMPYEDRSKIPAESILGRLLEHVPN